MIAFALRFWREIGLAVLLIAVFHLNSRAAHWHDKTVACESGRKADRKSYKAAVKKAEADNLLTVRATEEKWKGVVSETEKGYDEKLRIANAAVRAYADRVRNETTRRPAGQGGVSPAPGAPEGVDGTSQDTVVPVTIEDLNICAENTVKATSWQIFWKGITDGQAN